MAASEPVVVKPGLFRYPVREDEGPALLACRCRGCGRTFFPRREICPDCFDQGTLEETVVQGRGVIHASTVVHVPAPVGIQAPYAYGYVDMEPAGVRLFALFTGAEPASFTPGREVELVIGPVRVDAQGREVIGYMFRPAGQGRQR